MMKYPIGIQSFDKIRACRLNFAQVNFANCFRSVFPIL